MENSSNPEVGATSAAKAGTRRDEITRQERHDTVWLRDAVLPDDGPSDDMYRLAVPIWCEMPHEYLAEKLGPEYACGFAYGLEKGLSWNRSRKEDSVWEEDRPMASPEHPTAKPLALCQRAVENSSQPNDIVADPFLGSGTTLIAAERTGRRCYGMEIDPTYYRVVIARWEAFSGEKAEKA